MMYEEFKNKFLEACEDFAKEFGLTLIVNPVVKANKSYDSVSFVEKKCVNGISPAMNIERYYEYSKAHSFEEGFALMMNDYLSVMAQLKKSEMVSMNIKDIFNNLLEKVYFVPVNYDLNKELLKTVPHRRFLNDMAIIYRGLVSMDENGTSSFLIKNDVCEKQQISEEELFAAAKENTKKLFPANYIPIKDGVKEILPPEIAQFIKLNVFVITTAAGINGSCSLLYDDVLQEIAEKLGEDFYIIACNNNEIHAIGASTHSLEFAKDNMKDLEKEVNENDFLSDTVYYYSASSKKIVMPLSFIYSAS